MPPPWIIYKAIPSRAVPGRTDKFPCAPETGAVVDAHDPAIWTDEATARAAAARLGPPYGPAVVINPPYWFVDLDATYGPEGWSPAGRGSP